MQAPKKSPVSIDDTNRPKTGLRKIIPYAIIIAAVSVMIGYAWVGWNIMENQPDFSEKYSTAVGEQKDVTLPDGSQVSLDSDSIAEVSYSHKIRKVTVPKGQVIFTVTPNATNTFEVVAGKMRVIAKEGRFAVNTIRNGTQLLSVRTVVLQGQVDATRNSILPFQTHITLAAGQAVSMNADGDFGSVETRKP
jgi:transmembrane sensor